MNNGSNLFAQMLSNIDFSAFQNIVNAHEGDKGTKGFSCRDQLVTMLFAHIAGFDSLREAVDGLATQGGDLSHLGMSKAPSKSCLAYMNEHRSAEIYEEFFYHLTKTLLPKIKGSAKPGNFKGKLFSFDSTTIDLCLSIFEWARFHHSKGAIKIHTMLDHDSLLPVFANVTTGNTHDVSAMKANLETILSIAEKQSWIVMDRGYVDYELFKLLTEREVFFVTRLKTNSAYEIVEEHEVPKNRGIISDDTIAFTGPKGNSCPNFRRVMYHDAESGRDFVFVTNNFKFGATTIAQMYKSRWQVELFFKALKQNLKIKSFMGTSENAVKIQVYCALIATMLLKYMKFISDSKRKAVSKKTFSFSNLVALFRLNMTDYISLGDWLLNPFPPPPNRRGPRPKQINFLDSMSFRGGD